MNGKENQEQENEELRRKLVIWKKIKNGNKLGIEKKIRNRKEHWKYIRKIRLSE